MLVNHQLRVLSVAHCDCPGTGSIFAEDQKLKRFTKINYTGGIWLPEGHRCVCVCVGSTKLTKQRRAIV